MGIDDVNVKSGSTFLSVSLFLFFLSLSLLFGMYPPETKKKEGENRRSLFAKVAFVCVCVCLYLDGFLVALTSMHLTSISTGSVSISTSPAGVGVSVYVFFLSHFFGYFLMITSFPCPSLLLFFALYVVPRFRLFWVDTTRFRISDFSLFSFSLGWMRAP